MTDSFSRLIYPVADSEFQASYFEKQHLLVRRRDAGYYRYLLDHSIIDELLGSNSLASADCRIFRSSVPVPKASFVHGDESLVAGRVNGQAVYGLFRDGASIGINGAHRYIPALNQLCSGLADELSRWQCNLYCTPPRETGFEPHFDTHDVFVLQVAGRKHWRIYESPTELPLVTQKHAASAEAVHEEFTLESGDMLYLPRGVVHGATGTDVVSIHITLGRHAFTVAELLRQAVSLAAEAEPALRRSVPRELFRGQEPDFWRSMSTLVEPFVGAAIEERSTAKDRLPGIFHGIVGDCIDAESVTADSHLTKKHSFEMLVSDSRIILKTDLTELSFPGAVRDSLDYVSRNETFCVSDLPRLDPSGQIEMAKCLCRDGLFCVVK